MREIHKTALVHYVPQQMYALVDDIDAYAEFLPWCSESRVLHRDATSVEACLGISYSKLNKTFTTRNINSPHQHIEMQLIDGPFKRLHGFWTFTPLGGEGCKIDLRLEFEFSNRLLDMTVGPVFSQIANSLVDAFSQRAKQVYG